MAVQRADDEDGGHDGHLPRQSIRQRLRAIVNPHARGNQQVAPAPPEASRGEPLGEPPGDYPGQRPVQHPGDECGGVPWGTLGGLPGAATSTEPPPLFRKALVGNRVQLLDRIAPPTPFEQAVELLKFLVAQRLEGTWIGTQHLEHDIYPRFIATDESRVDTEDKPLSWSAVRLALGKIAKKRRDDSTDYGRMRTREWQYRVPATLQEIESRAQRVLRARRR